MSAPSSAPVVGVRLGDQVLDLHAAAAAAGRPDADDFAAGSLNAMMARGPGHWAEVRAWVRQTLADDTARARVAELMRPVDEVTMRLPIDVADYVDFYASEQHARNVGAIFRPDAPDLPAAWRHLPIGYHGRAGTVVVSGTDIQRPSGQRLPGPGSGPVFGPSLRLDIECEVGFVVGAGSSLGQPVRVGDAERHLFGVVLLNDWSARDIQAWEYVPLGPFLGKSFATSISAWVVPWEALSGARRRTPAQDPPVLPYLDVSSQPAAGLDLQLEVEINGTVVSRPPFAAMYWAPSQLLAHLTVNGASLRVGDLLGSGTVSGDEPSTFGSLLELTWNGSRPLRLADGTERGFLLDGDTVTLRGSAPAADGGRVSLGDVTGTVRSDGG
jgi:fumarylacetoacetase